MGAVEVYRKTKKTPDLSWNTSVCRPIAAVRVDLAKASRVTPTQITSLTSLVALRTVALLLLWLVYVWPAGSRLVHS